MCFFFFKQKTAYEMRISDWSSDVCSSDLGAVEGADVRLAVRAMATDMGWAAPMMRKATAMRFGGGTTQRKGASLRLEASEERFGVSVAPIYGASMGSRRAELGLVASAIANNAPGVEGGGPEWRVWGYAMGEEEAAWRG